MERVDSSEGHVRHWIHTGSVLLISSWLSCPVHTHNVTCLHTPLPSYTLFLLLLGRKWRLDLRNKTKVIINLKKQGWISATLEHLFSQTHNPTTSVTHCSRIHTARSRVPKMASVSPTSIELCWPNRMLSSNYNYTILVNATTHATDLTHCRWYGSFLNDCWAHGTHRGENDHQEMKIWTPYASHGGQTPP